MNFYDYLKETTLSRVFQHTNDIEGSYGIITAFKSGIYYNYKENLERNVYLVNRIRDAKYGFFILKGSYIEDKGTDKERKVKEDSFFVNAGKNDNDGNLKGNLKKWIKEFDQESALFKPSGDNKVFYLSGDGTMKFAGDFHPNRISDYMSKLSHRNGSFVFEGAQYSMGMMERMMKDHGEGRKGNCYYEL